MYGSEYESSVKIGDYIARQRKKAERAQKRRIQTPRWSQNLRNAHGYDFYRSPAWRELRFEALKGSNGCCSLCGRSNRLHGVILHVDHIKPRSTNPELELTLSNLQVMCEDCNMGKGSRDDTDWR